MDRRKRLRQRWAACCLLLTTSCVPLARASERPEVRVRLAYNLQTILSEDTLALPVHERLAFARAAPPFPRPSADPEQIEAATECLTAAAYHEARSEGEDGQRAVVQVVLNRVRHRAFPATICGVVYQRAGGCQFSFTCDGSLRRRREPQAWAMARRIAEQALDGYVYAPVGLSTRFHANYVRPSWSRTLPRVGRIGAHIFYLERGSNGQPSAFVRATSSLEPALPSGT